MNVIAVKLVCVGSGQRLFFCSGGCVFFFVFLFIAVGWAVVVSAISEGVTLFFGAVKTS